MERNIEYLPEDLLVEILSRVPEASLARLRSTSKGWNALIKKEERLAKKSLVVMLIHRRVYLVRLDLHGDNIVKVISQFSLNDPLSTYSLKEVDIHNVFHCDGLLLCTTMDERLVVWNPCSGETSRIIKPLHSKYSSDVYALERFGCVSLPVDPASYNLFALSVTREEQKLCLFTSRVEMYDIIEIWMATKIKYRRHVME
ncbi:unnamed protein product [Brassica napus]|uniref:(rape) hypothetical protein n=1 Tax=Brassica napus TaxID=3708 RepID=A0A816TMA2_BRANA|nr:unnamed protein product [Brassica napus]